MSEATEQALLKIFEEKMEEISNANKNLRRWMYSLIAIFGIGVLSGVYWAGMTSEKVNSITSNVNKITVQTNRIEAKVDDVVLYMAREFKYNPTTRGFEEEVKK